MVRVAGELGFTPSAWASLGMIDESGRGGAATDRRNGTVEYKCPRVDDEEAANKCATSVETSWFSICGRLEAGRARSPVVCRERDAGCRMVWSR